MITLLRRLGAVPTPTIDRDRAIELAKQECFRQHWPWKEPVRVEEGWKSYTIRTNTHMRGGNVIVRVSTTSEKVLSSVYIWR